MTTYTVQSAGGDILGRNLSAEEAAIEIMAYDGHEWEIRQDSDKLGWTLFTSTWSRNSTSYNGLSKSAIYSGHSDESAARAEIFRKVVRFADWFRHCDATIDPE